MTNDQKTFLVFGATGQTGRHFTALALEQGHRVRALARNPAKLTLSSPELEVHHGSITEDLDLETLLDDVDVVVCMLGDRARQQQHPVNTEFVRRLVPAMRRRGVRRFLYQAGGLSRPPGRRLSPLLWTLRNTVARGYVGQHRDNEAVMKYLSEQARDLEWIVHRAGIRGDGASRGLLVRSATSLSVGTFRDCAAYNLTTALDDSAVHTWDFSTYRRQPV